jgi:hypothetical protein
MGWIKITVVPINRKKKKKIKKKIKKSKRSAKLQLHSLHI